MMRVLEDSLARECPVSVSEIAAQNGYANAGCIRLEFPDLCRAIGQKIAQRGKVELASPATSCGSHCRQGTGADMIATAADGGS